MHKTCKMLSGLLVLLAGLTLLAFGYNLLAVMAAHQIAGILLALYGIAKLAHAIGACPMCKECCGQCYTEMPKKSGRR
ncbi:hypothetical protein J4220_03655 [Candidatus Micrarchaeota archaeon]|nr:hypothetical protein [Candidatus Micrarchaeota archaeon]